MSFGVCLKPRIFSPSPGRALLAEALGDVDPFLRVGPKVDDPHLRNALSTFIAVPSHVEPRFGKVSHFAEVIQERVGDFVHRGGGVFQPLVDERIDETGDGNSFHIRRAIYRDADSV
jgi:hypothetical protein